MILPFVDAVVQPESRYSRKIVAELNILLQNPSLPNFIAILGLSIILCFIISTFVKWFTMRVRNSFITRCQNRLTRSLMKLTVGAPYSWFLSQNSNILSRLIYEDVTLWNRAFFLPILLMINDLILIAMATGLLVAFSPWVGLGALVIVGCLAGLGFQLTRSLMIQWSERKKKAQDKSMLTVSQIIAGIRDIKLSSRESNFTDPFRKAYNYMSYSNAQLKLWHDTPSLFVIMLGQISIIAVVLVLFVTGMESGQIASQVALLLILTSKLIPAVNNLAQSFMGLWQAFPFIDGIYALRDSITKETARVQLNQEPGRDVIQGWNGISAKNLGYQYPNSSAWALKDIHLAVERGGSYGIVGQSGAGKSTLVDLLVGLLRPSEGSINIDNKDLSKFEISSWQKRIGYVSQTPFLIDDTLKANVAFGVKKDEIDQGKLQRSLSMANLDGFVSELEFGVDTPLGDRGIRMSGGQRQRIAIARALYNSPEILIFDEATSSLDSITENEIIGTLKNLKEQITLIIIAHRMTTVKFCETIFVLDKGALAGRGSFEELKADNGLFQKMVASLESGQNIPLAAVENN